MTRIIAVVGLPGAGKSEAVAVLENSGFKKVYFGGITLEVLKKQKLEVNESNERKIREELRVKHGMEAYAVLALPKIKKFIADGSDVVIDGLYSWEEFIYLKQELPQLKLLAIYAPPSLRHKRLASRLIRPLTVEMAQSRDTAQIEKLHQAGPIAVADFTIINVEKLKTLKTKVEEIINAKN